MVTPLSSRALRMHDRAGRDAGTASAPENSDDGRSASGNSARATSTNAWNGFVDDQRRDMRRHARGQLLAGQACAGGAGAGVVRELGMIQEHQVRRPGPIERRDARDRPRRIGTADAGPRR